MKSYAEINVSVISFSLFEIDFEFEAFEQGFQIIKVPCYLCFYYK